MHPKSALTAPRTRKAEDSRLCIEVSQRFQFTCNKCNSASQMDVAVANDPDEVKIIDEIKFINADEELPSKWKFRLKGPNEGLIWEMATPDLLLCLNPPKVCSKPGCSTAACAHLADAAKATKSKAKATNNDGDNRDASMSPKKVN
jgi:hypothetical protein